MKSKLLRSWLIPPDLHAFYPTALQCVSFGQEHAITISSAHSIVTFIFPTLKEAVHNDKKPLKHYLHKNLQPDVIKNIVTCQNESIILFENGTVKFFSSPKKLETVHYLSNVKAISSCQYGFVMIKLSTNDRKMLMELHTDSFTPNDLESRRIFDISFDEHPGLESTWRDSRYAINELEVNPAFLEVILNDSSVKVNESMKLLFFSVDCNLYLFEPVDDQERIDEIDHEITHVAGFSSNILRFWLSTNGEAIILELESEAIAVLYLKRDENKLECQTVFIAMNLEACIFFHDIFAFSDGKKVEWGKLVLNEVSDKFEYTKKSMNLVGISAMVFLEAVNGILCISENRLFHIIPIKEDKERSISSRFMEIDTGLRKHLNEVKLQVNELTDLYDNLKLQMICQEEISNILKLKENTQFEKNHFVAFLKPVILATHNKTFTITLANPLEQCKTPSFLTNVSIFAASYSNEFQTNMWNVRCRFKTTNGTINYINVKLTKDELIQPFDLLLQSDEPITCDIQIEINTIVKVGDHLIYIAFPVKTKILGDLKSSLEFLSPSSKEWKSGANLKNIPKIMKSDQHQELCYTIQFQKKISREKFVELFNLKPDSRDFQDPNKWTIVLFEKKTVTMEYEKNTGTVRLRCNDAHVMYYLKMLLYETNEGSSKDAVSEVKLLSPSILREYCVSNFGI